MAFDFEITQKIGVVSTSPKGWTLELNMVSWNGRAAKYDLREWDPAHETMSKGVTMTPEQLRVLGQILAVL
jgi:hypothetical protein